MKMNERERRERRERREKRQRRERRVGNPSESRQLERRLKNCYRESPIKNLSNFPIRNSQSDDSYNSIAIPVSLVMSCYLITDKFIFILIVTSQVVNHIYIIVSN